MELLYPHMLAWLLVFFRLTGIFMLTPMLGSQSVPNLVKVVLVAGVSFCVYPMLLSTGGAGTAALEAMLDTGLTLGALAPALAGELLFGYVLGYCGMLPLVGMQIGGTILDQQLGISAGGIFNPDFQAELAAAAQLLNAAATALFVVLGGHHVMLSILVGSFETFPLAGLGTGAATLAPDFVLSLVLGLLALIFDIALRIAAPLLCIVFLASVSMGFISRTVPQLNILSVGFIIRILGGLAIMVVSVEAAMGVFRVSLYRVFDELMRAFGAA